MPAAPAASRLALDEPAHQRDDPLAAEREHGEEEQRREHRVEARRLDAFERAEHACGAGDDSEPGDAGGRPERRGDAAEQHRDEELEREVRPVLARVRDTCELHGEAPGETADRRRGDERAEAAPCRGDAERRSAGRHLPRGAELDPRPAARERRRDEHRGGKQREAELVVRRHRDARRQHEPLRAARHRAEREQEDRHRPREDPRRHGDEHGPQAHDAGAGEDSARGRRRDGDERRGKRGPAGLRGEHRDGERADRHERALSERRHPAERDRQPEPRRREREVEAVRHRVDVHPRRRNRGDERGERDESRRRRVPVRPGAASVAGRLGERAAGAADERGHSSSSTASSWGRSATTSRTITSGSTSRYEAPSSKEPTCAFAIVASASPRTSPATIARSGEPNRTMSAATRPFSPSSAPVSTSTAPLGAATTAAIAAIPPAAPNAIATSESTGTPTMRAPSASDAIACSARPTRVRSSVQLGGGGERNRDCDDEERAHLDRRAADGHEAVVPDAAKRQRIGEDVARPREDRREHRVDRERDRRDRGDPADRRAAREVGLHREEVAPGARDDADGDPDDERDEEARRARGLLRHRPGAGRDQQRHEHSERDQLAVREMDDPRQPVDDGIADRDEPVHPARRKTRDDDLEREAHVAQ